MEVLSNLLAFDFLFHTVFPGSVKLWLHLLTLCVRLLAHAKVESVKTKEAAQQQAGLKGSWLSFRWYVRYLRFHSDSLINILSAV